MPIDERLPMTHPTSASCAVGMISRAVAISLGSGSCSIGGAYLSALIGIRYSATRAVVRSGAPSVDGTQDDDARTRSHERGREFACAKIRRPRQMRVMGGLPPCARVRRG